MRIAVIDCGSNSFRLLIVDQCLDNMVIIKRDSYMVRLGVDLALHDSKLSEDTFLRCKKIINALKELVQSYHCQKVICIGTSALRSALNAQEFIVYIHKMTGLIIHIISGKLESSLSFWGALGSSAKVTEGYAVLDIGGGSTEFAISMGGQISTYSTKLGAVRLSNMFWPNSDRPVLDQQINLRTYIKKTWDEAFDGREPAIQKLIGVAGTITNLAAISLAMEVYDSNRIEGIVLTHSAINDMLKLFCELNLEERKQIPGLQPGRADIIIAGTIVLLETMEILGVAEIAVSDHDLLQAIVLNQTTFQGQWQAVESL